MVDPDDEGDCGVRHEAGITRPPSEIVANQSLESLIRQRALLTPEALNRATLVQRESGEQLDVILTRLGLLSEQALTEAMAQAHGLDILTANRFPDAPVAAELSPGFLADVRALPVALTDTDATIAVANPYDPFVVPAFEFALGRRVRRVAARSSDIEHALDRLYRADTAEAELDEALDDDDMERLKDLVSDAPVIRAVNRLIAQASDEKASDIHIEPTDDALVVRFRVDGVLREATRLPPAMRAPLVSRIKVMADLNIAERRLPQDGRMRIAVRGHEIDLRVATSPSIHGESVVMRILDRSKLALDFTSLGFDEALAAALREAIGRPHGIVLVTGPTGSGKTTTLYAALAELNSVRSKLLTIEDPIEYRLPGVVQTQVNPGIGFTFATALRSFLRQDPDVMMVGEIRDTETAQIAVQAALTGHMILSTLHTNTAAGAVTRLLDMAVEPFLLSSVLSGVLAQRLVRRLCPDCRQPFQPDAAALAALGTDRLPDGATFYRAVGCSRCRDSGYVGRMALLEFLPVDAAVARVILNRPDSRDIVEAAQGKMRSLRADGLAKAASGLTTIEEVLRVSTED